jgi:hypothetical protein
MAVINTEQADSRWNKSCFPRKQKEYTYQKHCDKQQVRKCRYGITRLAASVHYCHSEFFSDSSNCMLLYALFNRFSVDTLQMVCSDRQLLFEFRSHLI